MKKILVLILICFIISCKDYKVNPKSFGWQPYKIGDKLIFHSNTNQSDTIFIKEITSYTNPNDHLDIFPNYFTTYFISGEISLIDPFVSSIGEKVTKDYVSLLEISSGENDDYLTLSFKKIRDTLSYPDITFNISELDSMFKNKRDTQSIKIDVESKNETPYSYDLKTFFWSKKFGYTKYEFKNGHYWKLTQFIRNNQNIFNKN